VQGIMATRGSAAFVLGSEPKSSMVTSASEPVEHLAAKERGQDADGEQELTGCGKPAAAIERQAASGDDAVHVGVEGKLTGPGVKHGRDAKLRRSAEPFRIATELEQRVGGGFHEQLEDDAPVAQGE
jgi:hypothetical protein